MRTRSKKSSSFLIVVIIILAFSVFFIKTTYDNTLKKPLSDQDEKITIEITEGESVAEILESLKNLELLDNKSMYITKAYLKLNRLEGSLKAGIYEIPKQFSIVEIITILQSGRTEDVWVSIPEGLRKDEIAQIVDRELSSKGSETFSQDEFLNLTEDPQFIETLGLSLNTNNLEGFLFPDKYAFPKEIDARAVIQRMVANFKMKVGESYTYEDIVLASIVEREGYNGNDRPIIAGIIIKRQEEGWLLQTDATLLYPVKNWKHVITVQDKEDDNPYNTYKRIGLPPTPICNPGLQSIQAVWEPVETENYFYIHDRDGNPHYARTLQEHNQNVVKYLR